MTIAAAWLLVKLRNKILIGIVGLLTIAWCLANFSIYLRPQTRLQATQWIFAHIPANATIYTEHWNDGLPLDLPNAIPYHRELLTVYDEDNAAKKMYYADKLVAGDFIILSSRRMWATMPYLGEKYPLTKLFYAKLLDGSFGYKEVATFTSYPQLFGIMINDDQAEESLQVFDHPTVRIFQNVNHISKEELLKKL